MTKRYPELKNPLTGDMMTPYKHGNTYRYLSKKDEFKEMLNKYPNFNPEYANQQAYINVMGNAAGTNPGLYKKLGLEQAEYDAEHDQAGLNKFREQATRDAGTASAWGNMAQSERERALGQNMQSAAAQSASGTANAWSQMAQSGGLRGGQRARIAGAGAGQLAAGQQGLMAQSDAQANQIRMQDEQNRIAQLQALPDMEAAYRAPSLQNMQTKLGLLGTNLDLYKTKAQADVDAYGNKVSGWGAMVGA